MPSISVFLEPASCCFDTLFEMNLVGFPVGKPRLPLVWLFGALDPAKVIDASPEKADSRTVDGHRHRALFVLEE